MDGYRAPFIPGWDTHGLPIEVQAIKKLKINKDDVSTFEFRKICNDFAMKYIKKLNLNFISNYTPKLINK